MTTQRVNDRVATTTARYPVPGTTADPLKLGDLLDDAVLDLTLLTGGPAAREREVVGVHSIELEHPAKWLERGWIMLTTGLELHDDEHLQRELIAELEACGVTALGFGVGVIHDDVPPALLDEAHRRQFPIFAIGYATPFRNVIRAAQVGQSNGDLRVFKRLTTMQRYLTDALGEERADAVLVERLGTLVDATAGIVNGQGRVVLGPDRLPGRAAAQRMRACTASIARIETDDFRGWAFPLATGDEPCTSSLVVGTFDDRPEHALIKPVAQLTVPLLIAIQRLEHRRRAEDEAVRTATVETLLDPSDAQTARIAAARVAAWGVHFAEGVKVVLARTRRAATVSAPDLAFAMQGRLETIGITGLVARREVDVLLLVPGSTSPETLGKALLDLDPLLMLGIGRSITDAQATRDSLAQAQLALNQVERRGRTRMLRYDDLDLSSILVGAMPPELLQQKVDELLAPLLENELAYETLVSYLQHDLDVTRTSRTLGLHANSTRYRLARVEQLLGVSLREPGTIAALHFALLSQQFLQAGHAPTAVAHADRVPGAVAA
jgi:purine catabolism regulator